MREPVATPRPANIIGIHLGAINTAVARFNEAGKAEITNNIDGEQFTPSVVMIEDNGTVVIGREAKKFIGFEHLNIFAEFNHELGTNKGWAVVCRNVTPIELTALLLKKVVGDYVEQFGEPTVIAITLPVDFRNEQREATKEAAKRAGLDNVHYLGEPQAVALHYGADTYLDGKYLIYNFDDGRLDVTLIEAHGTNIDVLCQDGVNQLGEKDLDKALLKIIAEKFRVKTGDEFDAVDCNFDKLAIASNKNTLSSRPYVSIRMVSAKHGSLSIVVSRNEFEAGITNLVSQTEMACENVLRRNMTDPTQHIKKSDIKEIFFAGEIARLPAMQASVERLFGKKPKVQNPDQAIAMGAAIYAAHKASKGTLSVLQAIAVDDVDVCLFSPHFFGIIYDNWLTGESTNVTVIRKGDILPIKRIFKLNADSRGYLPIISLTQSAIEEANPAFVTCIWQGELPRLDPNGEVILTFSYDENGMMCFTATEVGTGEVIKVDLRLNPDEHPS